MTNYLKLLYQKGYWKEHKNRRNFDHPVVALFAEQRIRYLTRYLNFNEIKTAFDYGCGDGFSCYYMARHIPHVEGGDVSEYMLEYNPLERSRLHLLDGEVLPFSNNSFDLVYCWEVLHHVESPERIIREMARVASKYVVLFEPNGLNLAQFLFGLIKKEERGTLRFRKSYLKRLADACDLKILRLSNVGWIFPNVTPRWLYRLLKHLPLEFPILTISCCLIAQKNPEKLD
jgi:SAM-dependent methyltransferase